MVWTLVIAGCALPTRVWSDKTIPIPPPTSSADKCYQDARVVARAATGTTEATYDVVKSDSYIEEERELHRVTTFTPGMVFYHQGKQISTSRALEIVDADGPVRQAYDSKLSTLRSTTSKHKSRMWLWGAAMVGSFVLSVAVADPDDTTPAFLFLGLGAALAIPTTVYGFKFQTTSTPTAMYGKLLVDDALFVPARDAVIDHNQRVAADCGYDGLVDAL